MTDVPFGQPWKPFLSTSSPYYHGTRNEIEFLKNLGTFASPTAKGGATRLQLLEAYLRSMDARAEWGAIDPHAVRREVMQMIAAETLSAP